MTIRFQFTNYFVKMFAGQTQELFVRHIIEYVHEHIVWQVADVRNLIHGEYIEIFNSQSDEKCYVALRRLHKD